VWEAKGAGSSKWMYNASKFRLADFSYKQGEKEGRNTKVLLKIGITDYKDLQGTNVADYAAELITDGEGGDRFRRYFLANLIHVI
jgi:hypothetical protein